MRSTPPIPERFRSFQHPGYTNIFSLLPACSRFYATETLFGDWDAQTLLLAKDAAPTSTMQARIASEGDNAWRHSNRSRGDHIGVRTNERLARIARSLPGTQLYGSATANMLCDTEGASRALPGFRRGPLLEYMSDALTWVIESMPNLRVIACLGEDAWYLASHTLGRTDARNAAAAHRDAERLNVTNHRGRTLALSCHFHPSRGSNAQLARSWPSVAKYLQNSPALAA